MRGQSMVEFLIVLPSLLLIVLGILQFSLMYQARNLLNHATFIGARQGALSGGDMTSIKDGVASAMAPLFMRVSLTSRPAMSRSRSLRMRTTPDEDVAEP
jgi:Flp pilus assembly protein TadG